MAKASFGNYFKSGQKAYDWSDDDWGDFGDTQWEPQTIVNVNGQQVNADGSPRTDVQQNQIDNPQSDADLHENVKNLVDPNLSAPTSIDEKKKILDQQISDANIKAAQGGNFLTRSWDKIKGHAQDWKDKTDKNIADYKEQQSLIPPPRPNVPVESEDEFYDEDITIDDPEAPNTKVKGLKGFMQRLLPGGKSGMKYVDPNNTFENWEQPVNNPLTNPQSKADVASNAPTNVPDMSATVATAWNNMKNGVDTSAGSATNWANNQPSAPQGMLMQQLNPNQDTEELPDIGQSYETQEQQDIVDADNAQREYDQTAVSTDPRQMIKSKTPGLKGFAQRLLSGDKKGYDYTQESLVDPNRNLAAELSQGKITQEEYKKLRQYQVEEDPSQQRNYAQEYNDQFGVSEEDGVSEAPENEQPGNIGIKPQQGPYMVPEDSYDPSNPSNIYPETFNPETDANEPHVPEDYSGETSATPITDAYNKLGPKGKQLTKGNMKSLGDWVSVYSPSSDNNNPEKITSDILQMTGYSADTNFWDMDSSKIADAQTKLEGGTGVKKNKKGDLWHNPGNLRFAGQPNAYEDPDTGFAVFSSAEAGRLAHIKQIEKDQGRAKANSGLNESQDNSVFLGANPPFNNPITDAWSNTMFKENK